MKIYQYVPLDKAPLVLKKDRVLLKQPKEFNDIYDCVFRQDPKDKQRIKKLLKDYVTLLIVSDVAQMKEVQNEPSIRFFNSQLSILKKALKKNPCYKGSPGFVIIYNAIVKRKPELKNKFEKMFSDVQSLIDKGIEEAKNDVIISCFSTRKDSLLMWSHYAGSHYGVCFEYDKPSIEDIYDVRYSRKRPTIKLFKAVARAIAKAIINDKDIKSIDLKGLEEITIPFRTKSLDWQYEKEVRVIFSIKNKDKYRIIKEDGKYYYEIGKPTAIYLGCRCNEDVNGYAEFMEMVSGKEIKVVLMKPSETSFEILEDNIQ